MSYLYFASLHLCVFALIIFSLSCSSKPTDLRTLAPAETLVYLETNDLAAALQPIIDSRPFTEVAKKKPDFASLRGVQLAVAVTGFETSEEKLTDEHSVGRVQPHFVAIADTHAWNYQAVKFAEAKLGSFVADIYDSEPTLVQSEKNGGKYFVWTAKDGRKAFALVIDSLIYFGNDETAIDKCLAVKRGEADSIAKTGKVNPASQETLASGYVSTDGIAQIANIVGLKFASEAGEDSEVQSAIAGILPQLLRNSITDITWSASLSERGIEDKYQINMPPDVANVFNETMAPSEAIDTTLLSFVPSGTRSVTQYNLKNPEVAWRSMLLSGQKLTDALSGKMILLVSGVVFQPYSIDRGEVFLSSVGPGLITMRNDDEESLAVISRLANKETFSKSFYEDVAHAAPLIIDTGNSSSVVLCGDTELIQAGQQAQQSGNNLLRDNRFADQSRGIPAARTVGNDSDSGGVIVDVLSERKSENAKSTSTYFTETRFTKSGMERKTTSDFGLIGAIIAQINQD